MPSNFLRKFQKKNQSGVKGKERVFTYDRDIICIPRTSSDQKSCIPIPRSREELSTAGLFGRIRLSSDMSEEELFDEIRSVFHGPMAGKRDFQFEILQQTGGGSKTLTVPALSSSYVWTAGAIAPKHTKTPIYILAKEPLMVSLG